MTYGSYQAGEEFIRGDSSVLYATEAGENRGDVALKVSWIAEESEAAPLLASIRRQERAVASGAKLIAPVFASGQDRGSVYCVLKRYTRSLLFVLKGKVVVSAPALETISRSVLASLAEMKALGVGAHGNLKLSNVLVEGTGDLRNAKFALTDLAPAAGASFGADLHALGMIILQLVLRREITAVDWPIAKSPHWKSLESAGDAWRGFCNALLDPALAKTPDPVAEMQKKLALLNQRRAVSAFASVTIWVCVLACLGAGGYFAHSYLTKSRRVVPRVVSDQEQNLAWCGRLAAELNKNPSWSSGDAYVDSRIAGPIRDLKLDDSQAQALVQLASGIPPKVELNTASILPVCKATNAALGSWESKQTVQRAYDTFIQRGWSVPASSISKLRSATFSDDTPIMDQIAAIGRTATLIRATEAKLAEFQAEADSLAKADDPVLHKIRPLADAEAGQAADVSSLPKHIQSWIDRLKSAGVLAEHADRARMHREGRFRVAFEAPIDPDILTAWEADAKRFQPVPEDEKKRVSDQWTSRFNAIDAKIKAGPAENHAAQEALAKLRIDAGELFKNLLQGDLARLDETLGTRANRLEEKPGDAGKTAGADKDAATFASLLAQLKSNDFSTLKAAFGKQLRDQFLADIKARTSPAFQARIADYVASLAAIPFAEQATLTPPAIAEWEGPIKTQTGAGYRWKSYTLSFVEVASDGESPGFYVCATELPVGLVIDWVDGHGGSWTALGLRTDANIAGPCAWMPKPGGGIAIRKAGFDWSTSMVPHLPFYQGASPTPPDALTPMNYISAATAGSIAKTLGFRLPTVAEWKRTYQLAQARDWLSAKPNLRDKQWESQRAYVADCVRKIKTEGGDLRDPPWPDTGIFLPSRTVVPQGEKAQARTSSDDGALWFAPVNTGLQDKPIANLVGNVAEFLVDSPQQSSKYYVAGASALSPVEVDAATPYELSAVQKLRGYADVGLRVALDAAAATSQASPDTTAFRQLLDSPPPSTARP